jgi:hypothetical protein
MKNYVIFRVDDNNHNYSKSTELYVADEQSLKSTAVDVTDVLTHALRFDTAREAYAWAGHCGCDWWKVGRR